MLAAVFFDLDDTLYEQEQPFDQAVKQLFPTFPSQKLPELFLRFRIRSDEHYDKTISGTWSLAKMRRVRLQEAFADLAFAETITDTLADQIQTAYDAALSEITLPLAIRQSLDYLADQKLQLGVITNGPVERQNQKLAALTIEHWIPREHLLISNEVGIQKPAVEIFQLAQERCGLTADQMLYVGDSFSADIVGAKNAGWQAIWFNHRKRALPTGQAPIFDAQATSFSELAELLMQLKNGNPPF